MNSIGFVGLGQIGGQMALRLIDEGYELTVYERGDALPEVRDAGATVVDTYPEVAADADAVITCLYSAEQVETVVFGEKEFDGLLREMSDGDVLIDHTTSALSMSERVAAALDDRGADMIGAAFSGGPHDARDGELTIMVGGPRDAYTDVKPVIESLTADLFYVGAESKHSIGMKLINNHVSFTNFLLLMESVALGEQIGLDPETMINVLNCSSGRSFASERYFPSWILEGSSRHITDVIRKDIQNARRFTNEADTTTLLADVAHDQYGYLMSELDDESTPDEMYDELARLMD